MGLKDKLAEALDDEIDLDFSQARDGDFGPVECRDYLATVIEAAPGTSKANLPKVVFKFQITEECPAKGRIFFKHAPARGEGAGILRETLRGLGIDPEKTKKLRPADTVGKEAVITVKFQKDSDEYQEIAKVKPVKAGASAGGARRSRLA